MIQKDEGGSYEFVSENGYHYELVEGFAIRDDDLRIPDKVFIKEPREVTERLLIVCMMLNLFAMEA